MKTGRPIKSAGYDVEIYIYPPDRRKRDIDNLCKATLDALTKARVWEDDSQVGYLQVARGETYKGGFIAVVVAPLINTKAPPAKDFISETKTRENRIA